MTRVSYHQCDNCERQFDSNEAFRTMYDLQVPSDDFAAPSKKVYELCSVACLREFVNDTLEEKEADDNHLPHRP